MTNLIKQLEKEQLDKLNKTVPDFKAGDTVRVMCKIIEAEGRERLQAYEGVWHQPEKRWIKFHFHRAQNFLWRRRGTRVPVIFSECCGNQSVASR